MIFASSSQLTKQKSKLRCHDFHLCSCIKSPPSPILIYIFRSDYQSPNGSARCIRECERVDALVFCVRGNVASLTHLVVAC